MAAEIINKELTDIDLDDLDLADDDDGFHGTDEYQDEVDEQIFYDIDDIDLG